MRRSRFTLTVLGVVAFLLGALTAVAPDAAGLVPVEAALDMLGSSYILVATFGTAALIAGLTVLFLRGLVGIEQAAPPVTEGTPPVPRPGAAADTTLQARAPMWIRTGRQQRVQTRLRGIAVDALVRGSGCTRDEAREHLDRGTWTDDGEAAAFLAGEFSPGPVSHMVGTVFGDPPARRAARRAAEEIARLDVEGWQ